MEKKVFLIKKNNKISKLKFFLFKKTFNSTWLKPKACFFPKKFLHYLSINNKKMIDFDWIFCLKIQKKRKKENYSCRFKCLLVDGLIPNIKFIYVFFCPQSKSIFFCCKISNLHTVPCIHHRYSYIQKNCFCFWTAEIDQSIDRSIDLKNYLMVFPNRRNQKHLKNWREREREPNNDENWIFKNWKI